MPRRACDALIANLTPFRGIAADPGTCFELDTRIGRLAEDAPTKPTSLYARTKDELRREVSAREASLKQFGRPNRNVNVGAVPPSDVAGK